MVCAIRPAEATVEWPKGTYLPEQRVEECAHGRHNKTCNPKREYVGDWTTQAPQPHIVTKSLRNTCVATAGIRGSPTAEEGLAHCIRLIGTGSSRGYSTPQQAARKALMAP